jgi:cobalt-zinc-cadmium efflux system outer membrane protein
MRVVVLLASTIMVARPVRAETVPVGALLSSSSQLTAWMSGRNAEVRAAGERAVQAGEEAGQSRVLPNPTLGIEVGALTVGETNPPGLGFNDTSHFSFGLTVLVELGKRGPRIRGAELRARAAGQEARAALVDRVSDARAALGKAAWLVVRQRTLEQNLQSGRELVALETRRRDAGDISDAELGRIVLDADALALDVEHNRTELGTALAECRAVLEATCATDDVDDQTLARAGTLPAVPDTAAALSARPDLRALDLERQAAGEDATLARRRLIPDPTLGVTFTHDNLTIAGNQPNLFTFNVSFPLPFLDTGKHDAAKAEARGRELREQARGATLEATAAIDGLGERSRWLVTAIDRLQEDSIPRSLAVVAATRKAYDTGHVSLSDLMLVERSHRDLVVKRLDLEFELFSTRSELRRALGTDLQKEPQ